MVETVLVSMLTAPFRASAPPQLTVAPVSSVMLASAMMSPSNSVPVPSVAELPTCQNISAAWPFITDICALDAVVSVLPI